MAKGKARAEQRDLVAAYASQRGYTIDTNCDASLRDFIMRAFRDAGLEPQSSGRMEITHIYYDACGIRNNWRVTLDLEKAPFIRYPNGQRSPGIVGRDSGLWCKQEYDKVNILTIAAKIVRDFNNFGRPHFYGDLIGRGYQIGVCGKALAEHVLGPWWLEHISARMRMFNGDGKTVTSIWKSDGVYLHYAYPLGWQGNERTIQTILREMPKPEGKADMKVSISALLLSPSIEGPWGRYKNATLTLKNLPQALCSGLVGRSLKDIVAGLPDDPVFAETIATSCKTQLAGDGHRNIISFNEATVPLYPEEGVMLKAA